MCIMLNYFRPALRGLCHLHQATYTCGRLLAIGVARTDSSVRSPVDASHLSGSPVSALPDGEQDGEDAEVAGDDGDRVFGRGGYFPGFYGLDPIVEENSDDLRSDVNGPNTDEDSEFSSFCSTSTTERECSAGREARLGLRQPDDSWTKGENDQ